MTKDKNPISNLEDTLKTLKPDEKLNVLITSKEFMKEDNTPISRGDLVNKNSLAIKGICEYLEKQKAQYVPCESLGLVGAYMTAEQIRELAKHPDVYSIMKNIGGMELCLHF